MQTVSEFAAILSSALFAGAALYINLVEHPARMQCGTETAAAVFGPSYRRATVMQVTLAMVATISSIVSWWLDDSILWAVGALLIFAVIPFTLIVILPTNKELLAPSLDRKSANTHKLLVRLGAAARRQNRCQSGRDNHLPCSDPEHEVSEPYCEHIFNGLCGFQSVA